MSDNSQQGNKTQSDLDTKSEQEKADLEKLLGFERKLKSEAKEHVLQDQEPQPLTAEDEALKLKNPFRGV